MVDTEREPLSIRVPRVVKYLSRPLTSATLFYALYILGEVHRSPSFAHKLREFSNELAKALYDFGICMVMKELNLHAHEAFYPLYVPPSKEYVLVRGERVPVEYIDPAEVQAFWEEIYEEEGKEGVRRQVSECINRVYPQYFPGKYETIHMLATCIVDRLNEHPRIMTEPHDSRENARWVRTWLEYYQKFKSPYFWDAVKRIFSITNKECKGWIASYGGRNYAMIAGVMQEYGKLSPITFVDLCFSLEHHTAVFIYKLATPPVEDYLVRCFLREGEHISELGIDGALRRLFDAARRGSEEDVRLILRCATSARQDWIMFGVEDVERAANPPAGLRLRQLRMRSEALLRRIMRLL